MIVLSYAAWEADVELGPIEEGGILHVPLFVSCATSMIARPANIPYDWSGSVPCAIETADFSKSLDMHCKGDGLATISMRLSMAVRIKCRPIIICRITRDRENPES